MTKVSQSGVTVKEKADSIMADLDSIGAGIARLREENERLRKALWDCAGEAGADLDGNPTPSQSIDVAAFALDAVKDLRQCYDSELRREL